MVPYNLRAVTLQADISQTTASVRSSAAFDAAATLLHGSRPMITETRCIGDPPASIRDAWTWNSIPLYPRLANATATFYRVPSNNANIPAMTWTFRSSYCRGMRIRILFPHRLIVCITDRTVLTRRCCPRTVPDVACASVPRYVPRCWKCSVSKSEYKVGRWNLPNPPDSLSME